MKIKPLYIYLGVFIVAVISLIIFSNIDSTQDNKTMTEQMPDDEVHRGLRSGENPHGDMNSEMGERVNHGLEQMEKKYKENPNDTLVARQYADFLAMAHQPENAIPVYEKILNKNSKRIDIRNSLAYLYLLKKDYNKSEEMLNGIIKLDKNNTQAKFNLGIVAIEKGDNKEAKRIWNELIKSNPNDPMAKRAENAIEQMKL